MSEKISWQVPAEVAAAVSTGRPELLKLNKRSLNIEEVAELYGFIGELIARNFELQRQVELQSTAAVAAIEKIVKHRSLLIAAAQEMNILSSALVAGEEDADE